MTGPKIVALAWRNLWRQRRRTLLTLSSIAFGLFLAIMMTAMQDRAFAEFIDTAARLGAGHVTLQHPEFQDRPTLKYTVDNTADKRAQAKEDPLVVQAVDRASGQTMVSTASESLGALFIAYDPALETPSSFEFGDDLVAGEMFTTAQDDGVVLGSVLARNLGAELGDKVVFTLTDRNGEVVTHMERLSGVVGTGAPSLDAALVLLPIDSVRTVLGYDPTESTQVALFLNDGRKSGDAAARLRGALGSDVAVLTWDEIQPEIRAFVAMKVGGAIVFEVVVGLLVAAGIFNTLFMSVMERSREFGIMMALGYAPRQLFALVMAESGLLAALGLGLGTALTLPLYNHLAATGIDMTELYAQADSVEISGVGFDVILQVGIFPENAALIAVAVVLATLLAGVWPAYKAGRVSPVDSINLV